MKPPSQPLPPWPADAIEVGRIGGAWGVKGWFKVQPFAADPQALFAARHWFIQPAESASPALAQAAPLPTPLPTSLEVVEAKEHAGSLVARSPAVVDRDGAQRLYGARVFVSRTSFPQASIDEFYWVDLIGLDVVNREGQVLGQVDGLIDTGPHSVLRVAPAPDAPPDAERLIPFVAAYIDDVSLAQRRIGVDWGLDF